LRNCVLGTMAFASGQLLQAEQRFSEALAQARTDPDSQPLAALIADRLAGTYIILGEGEKAVTLGRWAVGTGCLDAAAASQTRALIAIGVSQVAGPGAALADLGYLEADPARVGPADVDGLTFRGVFRLLVGDLDGAVSDMTAGFKLVRKGAILNMGLRTCCYLALAQYLTGAWDDALLTSEQHARLAGQAAASLSYGQERIYAAMARALVCQASSDYLGMADALGPWRDGAVLDGRSHMYAVLWLAGRAARRPRTGPADLRPRRGNRQYRQPGAYRPAAAGPRSAAAAHRP
jgi:hypothetical protein